MVLFFTSILAGAITVLTPCVLPLLPVVMSGSISGTSNSHKRAYIITASLALSVVLFTFLLKISTLFINIPQHFWVYLSGGVIFLLGLIFVFPKIWYAIPGMNIASIESSKTMSKFSLQEGSGSAVLLGASLGPVFSTCSPTYFYVLATVLPASLLLGTVYLFAYVFGLAGTLLLIAIGGQKIISRFTFATREDGWFRKILGVILITVGIMIMTGLDQTIELAITNSGAYAITNIDQKILEASKESNRLTPENNIELVVSTTTEAMSATTTSTSPIAKTVSKILSTATSKPKVKLLTVEEKAKLYPRAPDISSPDAFINTGGQPITLSQYRGKNVVLVEFWTYSCINCKHVIPYLKTWYSTYKKDGLVIVGIHTPEFAFERVEKNVRQAVIDEGIEYPVVMDNDFSTWNAYKNQYWPRKYLIDIDGYIVYDHIGEWAYDETERQIQKALEEKRIRDSESEKTYSSVVANTVTNTVATHEGETTPEIYFGSNRNVYLKNGTAGVLGSQPLVIPEVTTSQGVYLDGTWNITSEYAEGGKGNKIVLSFTAGAVHFVASGSESATVSITLDGVDKGEMTISKETIYDIVKDVPNGMHTLNMTVKSGTLRAYTFTFN